MKCIQLKETGLKQNRWLSIPGSRIVVNPFCFNLAGNVYPSQYSNRAYMPLNIGYLPPVVPESGIGLNYPDLLMMHEYGGVKPQLHNSCNVDLSDSAAWTLSELDKPGDCEALFDKTGVTVKVRKRARDYWQYVSATVEVDLDRTPLLQVEVPECLSAWGVKVAPEYAVSPSEDIAVIDENSSAGVFAADISKATGWKGVRRFKLRLFAYGLGKTIKYTGVSIAGVSNPIAEAEWYETGWAPHELEFRAKYPGGTVLEGYDTFLDAGRVCRRVEVAEGNSPGMICIGGRYKGKLKFIKDKNLLLVADNSECYAIKLFGMDMGSISFYTTYCDYLSGYNSLPDPPEMGYWQVKGEIGSSCNEKLYMTVAFPKPGELMEDVMKKAGMYVSWEEIRYRCKANENFWDSYLDKVPKPANFSLKYVNSKGLTSESVEKQYYSAWIFLASNILPNSPEAGYDYPQIACGKPSLWGQGAPEAPYTASWESLIAMQLYAYVDPHLSWEAFKGLISLVDNTGMLAGESLPSRKAQTAYILYEATGDKESLTQVYPGIKKYMLWRVDNPRWILGEINDPNDRDADFVVSALVDILYLIDIVKILRMEKETLLWEEMYLKLYENYKNWFWEAGGSFPYEHYDVSTGIRQPGHTAWVLTGVYLPRLEPEYQESLIERFTGEFDTELPFGGLDMPKYPEMSFDIWGLMDKGYSELADKLMEVCIRDVTQANFFSEQYDTRNFPYPTGVRPSIFGCALLIECVLMKAGHMLSSRRK